MIAPPTPDAGPFSASIEWVDQSRECGILRLHPVESGSYESGDPFIWSAFLSRDGDLVTLKGVCTPIPKRGRRPVVEALLRDGIRRYRYERLGTPQGRTITRDLAPASPDPD